MFKVFYKNTITSSLMTEKEITNTDEDLMIKVLSGDRKAFYILVTRWNKPMVNYFYKNVFNQEISEELAQDVFINLWKAKNYTPKVKFYVWLYKIAKNRLIDFKRQNKNLTISIDDNPEVFDEIQSNHESFDDNLIKNEEAKMVKTAISNLGEEERDLLIMSKYQKLKYEDISKILNCSTENVKVKVFRAVKSFVKKFNDLYGDK